MKVRVPNVVGKTESRATCSLAALGLRWRYRGEWRVRSRPIISCAKNAALIPDPRVISQSPVAGARVPPHRAIVLDDECLRRVLQQGAGRA